MTRDPRYDVLFEPVDLGPVTAPNRFYQVPHCSGMGYRLPRTLATMRGMKAEGGWGVVCTEYCSIHPTSDDTPFPFATLWDDKDVKAQALMTETVHSHGALAGVELWHGGGFIANLASRTPTLGVKSQVSDNMSHDPIQSRVMGATDIKNLRTWQVAAAKRALQAEFDIVYIYATHGYLLSEFLSPETNNRSDEYGGSLENRVRIVRELIEETKAAVGHKCGVAVRFSLSLTEEQDESRDMLAMLAELPDLWDITVDNYAQEMGSSRFVREAAQEETIAFAKTVTSKPVVGVGRFTSPDTMVRQVRKGVLDLIGAARPSIADPFIPNKIKEGRIEDIRECIGCNICYAHNSLGVPIRCTQNPTMGEEWRRGWHPEKIAQRHADESVLVVGGGPAGLEAARALGQRGYQVTLAEAKTELGGRVTLESRLPGLAEWARVRDWRLGQLNTLPNVQIYLDSELSADEVRGFGFRHVVLATGARWNADGIARFRRTAFDGWQGERVYTPDHIMADQIPEGSVLIYDDDHYYMGPVLALKLRKLGRAVTLVTPQGRVAHWARVTAEQDFTNAAILEAGVTVITNRQLESFDGSRAGLSCIFTGQQIDQAADSLVVVGARTPNDALYQALAGDTDALAEAEIATVKRIGDCEAPGIIAAAVYSGHRAARNLGNDEDEDAALLRRERSIP